MATLSVGGTTVFDGATLQSGAVLTSATYPAGHILQTVSSTFNGQASGSGTTPTLPHADCSVDIIPSHASNKILITVHSALQSVENEYSTLHFFKDGSEITGARGDTSDNRINCAISSGYTSSTDNTSHRDHELYAVSAQYFDTAGGTSEITYDFRVRGRSGAWYCNQPASGSTNGDHVVMTISTITVQEIMRA